VLATPSSACSADENEGGSGDEEPSEGRARECDSAEAAIQRALRCSAYAPSEVVGEGAYGCVWSGFVRAEPDRKVAIKHCIDPFRCKRDAVRSLREIRLLKLLKHPRIVELRSVVLPAGRDFTDLHLVFDLAECDLSKMVKSETIFDESHRRWILYQILQVRVMMTSVVPPYRLHTAY
jgi:serine/threonine protein kinase